MRKEQILIFIHNEKRIMNAKKNRIKSKKAKI